MIGLTRACELRFDWEWGGLGVENSWLRTGWVGGIRMYAVDGGTGECLTVVSPRYWCMTLAVNR